MGRRKNSVPNELVGLPWQVSAILGVGVFIGVRWILPGFLQQRPLLAPLASGCDRLSWIALCGFGFLALLAFARASIGSAGGGPVAEAAAVPAPTKWSVEALRALEWKRFELLCGWYYEAVGFSTATLAAGPDGGIDVKLFKADPSKPLAIVQCKAWNTHQVGVKEIRELLGVMAHEKVGRGIFATTGTYTKAALEFGAANPIQLLDGPAFEKKILELSPEKQQALLERAFEGDYRTPTCASCGVKMLARDSRRGQFWGCQHYPRCRTTLLMRPHRSC